MVIALPQTLRPRAAEAMPTSQFQRLHGIASGTVAPPPLPAIQTPGMFRATVPIGGGP
jgi:hypothetical protein